MHNSNNLHEKIKQLLHSAIVKDQKGRPDLAEQDLRQALNLNNKHPEVLNLLSVLCNRSNRLDEALKLSKKATKFAQKSAPIHFNYGNLLATKGDFEAARSEFIKATSLDKKFAPAYKNLGSVLAYLRQFTAAIDAFEYYIQLKPEDHETRINLAVANLQVGHNAIARDVLQQLYDTSENPSFELVHNLALARLATSQTSSAEKLFKQATEIKPDDYDAWLGLAQCLSDRSLPREAQKAFQQAKQYGAESVYCDFKTAEALLEGGFYDESLAIYSELCEKYPDNTSLLISAAMADSRMGDFDAQEQKLRHVLKLDSTNMSVIANLANIPNRKFDDKDIKRLSKLVSNSDFDTDARRRCAFALGDIFRGKKDYDKAFEFFKIGNDLKGYVFDRTQYSEFVDQIIDTFSANFFDERADWGNKSDTQILIVGTPRSGTTLTEQILAAHPQIVAAGERGTVPALSLDHLDTPPRLQDQPNLINNFKQNEIALMAQSYLVNLCKAAVNHEKRVTNKLPANFQWVGLFALLFPNGKIIHTRRDPKDSLLSIYFKDFGGMHDYAYKLEDLGYWYKEYERLMAHWNAVLGERILNIDYEYTVDNQEQASRQLLQHTGLDWDESVLNYYKQKNLVKTASIWQVRQPIYKTSVKRWSHYEKHLHPLFEALK